MEPIYRVASLGGNAANAIGESLYLEPPPFCRLPMSLSGSSDATTTSHRKRHSVYVDIPHTALRVSLTNRKRTPGKMVNRKGVAQAPLSSRELNRSEVSATSSDSVYVKKRKISSGKSAKVPYVLIEENKNRKIPYDPDFPNGFFYCHQCNKKRAKDGIYLTFLYITSIHILITLSSGTSVYCQ